MMKRRLLFEIVAILLLCSIFVICVKKKHKLPLEVFKEKLAIRRIIVLRADTFDCTMKDNSRLLVKLPVYATDDSKDYVINLINHGSSPKIILHEKQKEGHWIADFFINQNNKDINLSNLLLSKNLVYK